MPRRLPIRLLVPVLVLAALAVACASTQPALKPLVVGETAIVQAIHNVVEAEKAAYAAGAFDRDHHRKYLRAEQRIINGEAALNDALLAWARDTDRVVPEQVKITAGALREMLDDLGDTWTPGTPLGTLVSKVEAAMNLLVPTRLPGQ